MDCKWHLPSFPVHFCSTYGDWKDGSTIAWPQQIPEYFLWPLFHTGGYPSASVLLSCIKNSIDADEVSGILISQITKWSSGSEVAFKSRHLVLTRNSVTRSDKGNWILWVLRISLILFWTCLNGVSITAQVITAEQLVCANSLCGHI